MWQKTNHQVSSIMCVFNSPGTSSVLVVWNTCDVCGSSQREDQRSVQLLWLGRQHSFRIIEETCELRLNLWTPQSRDQPQSGTLDTAHTNTQIEDRQQASTQAVTGTVHCHTTDTTAAAYLSYAFMKARVKWIKQHMHLTEGQSAFNCRLIG